MFAPVVCALGTGPTGQAAARQAAHLTAPEGELVLVVAVDPAEALGYPGRDIPARIEALRAAARHAVVRARLGVAHERVRSRVEAGAPRTVVDRALAEERPGLVAVGATADTRASAWILGALHTQLLARGGPSLLVARAGPDLPRRVVVDARPTVQARWAVEVARAVGRRARSPVAAVGLHAPLSPDVDPIEMCPRLLDVLAPDDLVVVGLAPDARRLATVMGAVGEIVHRAPCSVLVVRGPTVARRATTSAAGGSGRAIL